MKIAVLVIVILLIAGGAGVFVGPDNGLLIPAVEKFGRNTAQTHVALRESDPRVPAVLAP